MPLHGKDARLVVQLLGHVFADVLHLAAAGGVLGFMAHFPARQVGRERLALGLPAIARGSRGWGELLGSRGT